MGSQILMLSMLMKDLACFCDGDFLEAALTWWSRVGRWRLKHPGSVLDLPLNYGVTLDKLLRALSSAKCLSMCLSLIDVSMTSAHAYMN